MPAEDTLACDTALEWGEKKKSGACIHRAAQETGFSLTSFGALKELESFGFLGTAENKKSHGVGGESLLWLAWLSTIKRRHTTWAFSLWRKRVEHVSSILAFPRAGWGNNTGPLDWGCWQGTRTLWMPNAHWEQDGEAYYETRELKELLTDTKGSERLWDPGGEKKTANLSNWETAHSHPEKWHPSIKGFKGPQNH